MTLENIYLILAGNQSFVRISVIVWYGTVDMNSWR